MSLRDEIFEQPARLNALLRERREVEKIARLISEYKPHYVFLAARGSSDNAGRYANYLWGAHNGLPLALAAPSLFSLYASPPKLSRALVVAVSQSGKSPDIVGVVEEGKRQGCLTLAVTNSSASPLAKAAEIVLDIKADPESSVAATKTYTAELLALAMISVALRGDETMWSQLQQVPAWIQQVLVRDGEIARMAERYRYMYQCVVLGRGFNYATAFEWALKLKELTYVVAEPHSSADFEHGPIALVEGGFPVFALCPSGKVFPSMFAMLERLRQRHDAELVVISDDNQALSLAQSPIRLPNGIPEWLTPLVSIVPAQLFSSHLTRVKGYDTERPRIITKVTETQ
jgi:glucosamine--fructose-6-phosphate aminotransferase (isomerizing)